MRLLAVDSGNTRIKWALFDDDRPHRPPEYGSANADDSLGRLAAAAKLAQEAAGCDVVGKRRKAEIENVLGRLGCVWLTAQKEAHGVRNCYLRPASLGADRWCALVAMRALYGHGIVLSSGTAITIDALDRKGRFVGGLILPGRTLMHRVLAEHTGLPEVGEAELPPAPLTTEDALMSGSLFAAAGAAEKFAKHCDLDNAPLVVTGGASASVAALLPGSEQCAHLILRGVSIAHRGQLELGA